jgi:voltage-gated potassium channel
MPDSTGDPRTDGSQNERPQYGMVAKALLRAAGSTVVLVAAYYLLPLDRSSTWSTVAVLALGLAALITLVGFYVRQILASPFPGLRAVEALATCVPFALLLFASTYFMMERISADNFSESLTRTDALYFTVAVFTTVGFGDITPKTQAARLVVTGQMITDLVIIGLVVHVIVGAVKRERQRRSESASAARPTQ